MLITIIIAAIGVAVASAIVYEIGRGKGYDEGYAVCGRLWQESTVAKGVAEWVVFDPHTGRTIWQWKDRDAALAQAAEGGGDA